MQITNLSEKKVNVDSFVDAVRRSIGSKATYVKDASNEEPFVPSHLRKIIHKNGNMSPHTHMIKFKEKDTVT